MKPVKQNTSSFKKVLLILPALLLVLTCKVQTNYNAIELNQNYQFASQVNGKFFCRGIFVFDKIDEKGVWHGIQKNETTQKETIVTAQVLNDTLEVYTAAPWNETWKVTSIKNEIASGTVTASYSLAQNSTITFEARKEGIPLDKSYQFTSYINEEVFCNGTFYFYDKDENGLWHGSQQNETQKTIVLVTAKLVNDNLEIYTAEPWKETWTVTSAENGTSKGSVSANYSLAQNNTITFELSEIERSN
ncbi:hypothetical protein [Carboxylicivirga marina]|nr:hypothetical protein [Carboxylicivirga marina]